MSKTLYLLLFRRLRRSPAALILLVVLALLTGVVVEAQQRRGAQPRQRQQRAAPAQPSAPAQSDAPASPQAQQAPKRIYPLRSSDTTEGSRVTITSDVPLNDYSVYRSGDRFYVRIPRASAAAPGGVRGRGFTDVQTTRQGNDLIYSFRLQPGARASVSQRFNRIDVNVVAPGEVAAPSPTPTPRTLVLPPGVTREQAVRAQAQPTPAQPIATPLTPAATPRAEISQTGPQVTGAPTPAIAVVPPPVDPTETPAVEPTAQGAEIAQAQPPQTAPDTSTTTIPQPVVAAPDSVSLGAAVAQNWPFVLLGLLLVATLVLFVFTRSSAARGVPAPPPAAATQSEAVTAAELPQTNAVLAPVAAASAAPVEAIAETTSAPVALVATETPAAAESVPAVATDAEVEAETVPAFDPERAQVETGRLLSGESYDEAVIGAAEKSARGVVAAELLAALSGRNLERRERARAAFVQHGYFDEAMLALQTAETTAERAAAARSLGLVGDRAATPHLLAALQDPSLEVRRASVEALTGVRDPAAVPALEALRNAEKERKAKVRVPRSMILHAIEVSSAAAVAEAAPEPAVEEATAETLVAPPTEEEITEPFAAPAAEATAELTAQHDVVTEEVTAETAAEELSAVTEEAPAQSGAPVAAAPVLAGAEETATAAADASPALVSQAETETLAPDEATIDAASGLETRGVAEALIAPEAPATVETEIAPTAEVVSVTADIPEAETIPEPVITASPAFQDESSFAAETSEAAPAAEETAVAPASEEAPVAESAAEYAEAAPVTGWQSSVAAEVEPATEIAEITAESEVEAVALTPAETWDSSAAPVEDETPTLEAEAPLITPEQLVPAVPVAAEIPVAVVESVPEESAASEFGAAPAVEHMPAAAESEQEIEQAAPISVEAEEYEFEFHRAEPVAETEYVRAIEAQEQSSGATTAESEWEEFEISPANKYGLVTEETPAATERTTEIELAGEFSAAGSEAAQADARTKEIAPHVPAQSAETETAIEPLPAEPREATPAAYAQPTRESSAGFSKELERAPESERPFYAPPQANQSGAREEERPAPPVMLNEAQRAAEVANLARLDSEDAFRRICAAFDDSAAEVRDAAAQALYNFGADRAGSFTRALREAPVERRRRIGAAISSSGLAAEAMSHLTGESRDRTYDAFSLLFLMAKAGEVQPLIRAIESHPNNEVRLAVVKLLALSGQNEVLPAFRRLAVRGSLPTEVRSAVMEAIYQISSSQGAPDASRTA